MCQMNVVDEGFDVSHENKKMLTESTYTVLVSKYRNIGILLAAGAKGSCWQSLSARSLVTGMSEIKYI